MNKHTPGPWRLHGRCENFGLPHSLVATNTLIAKVYSEAFGDIEQETANARLIAAAPDLLDALRELLAVAPSTPPAAGLIVGIEQRHRAALDAARAAIKKATGDEP